ncbi:MAG: hypothetical protein RL621_335 [Bacteroidota bacterium]|jgi:hypothetical protein
MEHTTKVYGVFEVYKDYDEYEHEQLTACFLSEGNAKSECQNRNHSNQNDSEFIVREIPLCDC